MKFVILADIHLGPEGYYKGVLRKINKDAKLFLHNFIEQMNNNIKPEFVVVLGDLIEDDNAKNDKKNIAYIVSLLKKLNCPIYYVAGNHDLKNISEDELMRLFKQNSLYYSFDSKNFHFIVLFSKKIQIKGKGFTITGEQTEWLRKELNNTKKDCIIFTHASLADQNLTGNPWFEGRPDSCLILNRNEIRRIFESSGKVKAVFNSHLHWNKQNIHKSIPYFTIQSLIENEEDRGIASEAYAVVNITSNKVEVEIKGNYSKKFMYS